MTHQRRARVVVRARDPGLRALILRRLSEDGDLEVTETSAEALEAETGPTPRTP